MGTIQNAFNQMLGVAAGGISTAKLLKNQKKSNDQMDLNIAEGFQDKAQAFNKEVEGLNAAIEENASKNAGDVVSFRNMMEKSKVGSKEWELYRDAMVNAQNNYQKELERLQGIRSGLEERKSILEVRKSKAEKVIGKNKLGDIKLADIKDVSEDKFKKNVTFANLKSHIKNGGKR